MKKITKSWMFVVGIIIICSIFNLIPKKVFAVDGWTEQTNSGVRDWRYIASSNDGTKLAAVVYGGYIYTSTDSGKTWIERTSAGSRNWYSIASSSDGTKLAAGVYGGSYIYISSDSGVTWIERNELNGLINNNWPSVASSSDGMRLVAVPGNSGKIYLSSDGGNTWTHTNGTGCEGNNFWWSVSSSSDGMKLIASSTNDHYLCSSIDGGTTWTKIINAGARGWNSVASSGNGTKLVAGVWNGYIYTSDDGGATWIERTNAGIHNWDVSSSSGGDMLIAIDESAYIYTSIDSGETWRQELDVEMQNWRGMLVSPDGSKFFAAASGGYIYTSNFFPIISSPSISGTPIINHTLTGLYIYTDEEGDLEGTSTYKWYRDDVVVDGQTSITYETTRGDIDKIIKFEVTPVAQTGAIEGEPVLSTGVLIKNEPARGSSVISVTPPIIIKPIIQTPPKVESPIITLPVTPSDNLTNTNSNKPVTITHTLKPKVRSDEVKALQIYLNTHGYPVATSIPGLPAQAGSLGNETNFFGPLTKAAVIKFQIANNLIADGIVGSITRSYLK